MPPWDTRGAGWLTSDQSAVYPQPLRRDRLRGAGPGQRRSREPRGPAGTRGDPRLLLHCLGAAPPGLQIEPCAVGVGWESRLPARPWL